jgi:serine protease Do
VTLPDGKELPAKVIGADSQTDVAVIQLLSPPKDLVAARLGDSDKLDVGEWVLAVGSPLGLDQTVTAGIVSSKGRVGGRVHMSGDRVRQYIQTDAMINPGNSGGPLVNLNAEVVGINTLINTGPGGAYGFAIPINQVRGVANSLMKDGRVHYAYLGVLVGDLGSLEPAKKAQLGNSLPAKAAFVSDVTPGGPAGKAGVKPGDVITALDGKPVGSAGDVIDEVSTRTIGAQVKVSLIRQGKPMELVVTLGELPTPEARGLASKSAETGMDLQTLTPPLAESLGLPTGSRGAVVAEVREGGPADKAGLAAGDVIIEIDRKPVATAEEAEAVLATPRKGGHLLRVRGPSGSRFVNLGAG